MNEYKILLVEDDRFISDMYMSTLHKAGFAVDVVVTGTDGIHKIETGNYDLALIDIMLPEKTGTEVLEALHEAKSKPDNTRIVIMTNFNMDDKTREKLETMSDGYLIKADITPSELVDIINKMRQE